ncbi:hypothetical protein GH714_043455 [Hevea brasiliensis]|uniref:Uncharacterized protein n=1 Tax=Hevea brasiliensis TaxID=3981 RepID=A0A6A6K3X5_HEVBR|nr:hypothetical protein GH714_043455 [Hevea brasiliensis]
MVTQNQPKITKRAKKSTYKCTHCDQPGHTKDRIYELVGYPEWWDHNRAAQKRNLKRTPTATVIETNTDDDGVRHNSALVTTANGAECNYKNEEENDVGQSDDSGASLGHDEHLEAKGEIEAGDEHLEAEEKLK